MRLRIKKRRRSKQEQQLKSMRVGKTPVDECRYSLLIIAEYIGVEGEMALKQPIQSKLARKDGQRSSPRSRMRSGDWT